MDIQEAVHKLTSSIEFKSNMVKRLFDAGVEWEKAQNVADEIIHDLFTSDIPRPELVEAYNNLSR